jgi:DNA recombination protein RmuC
METNTLLTGATLLLVGILFVAVLIVLFLQFRKPRINDDALISAVQTISQAVQQEHTQMAVLNEKVAHLEPVTQTIQSTLTTKLGEVQQGLSAIYSNIKARQEVEQRTSDSISRLEAVIAGTQTKGSAGENVVELVFAKLPVEWQVRDFTVNGKTVEFGIRLPNNLIVPIDSKWPATHLIEQFISATDVNEQKRLKAEIDKSIIQKAKEVSKYIDPNLTMPFGIAVVPDSVYDLSASVQADVFQLNVVLVSYSMFVPYLLLVVQTAIKTGENIDLQRLDAYLKQVQASVASLQEELDGRFSRALTMLGNSRDDMRASIGKAGGAITSLQITAAASAPALTEPAKEQ